MNKQTRLMPGDILRERYRINGYLGRGGMGTVYLAEDINVKGRQRAIKELLRSSDAYQQFIDEADILVKLDHPYLPNISDYFPPDDEGYSYLIMDYIKGETLQKYFELSKLSLDYRKVLKYAVQLCDLFQYLHDRPEPIVYRDLKPSNIMIDEQDNVRLIDFGIARNFKEGQFSDTVQLGTVGFAAPEQFEKMQTDHRTDLYSLGSVLYYLLSGGKLHAFVQQSLSQLKPDLPASLIASIHKLLMYNPDERYQNAAELKKDLEQILHGRAYSGIRRWRIPAAVAGVVLIAASIGYMALSRDTNSKAAVTQVTAADMIKTEPVIYAQRKTVLTLDATPEQQDLGGLEWRLYDANHTFIETKPAELGGTKGTLPYEFAKAGDYVVEAVIKNGKKEKLLSRSLVHALPAPKVWFTPVLAKGDKFVTNQKAEFRGMKDEAFKPVKWAWSVRKLKNGEGKEVQETVKALAGDTYPSTRFSEPGIYELKVQAEDAKGTQSDRYTEQIFVYYMPTLEMGTGKIEGDQMIVPYDAATKNIRMEEDFSPATVQAIKWNLLREDGEKLKDGEIALDRTGTITIDITGLSGLARATFQVVDSTGAKSAFKTIELPAQK